LSDSGASEPKIGSSGAVPSATGGYTITIVGANIEGNAVQVEVYTYPCTLLQKKKTKSSYQVHLLACLHELAVRTEV